MLLPQHLTIGLLAPSPGWELLLEQIGAIWKVIPPNADIAPTEYSVVIAQQAGTNAAVTERLLGYAETGGSLLDESGKLLRNLPTKKAGSRNGIPPQIFPFGNGAILPIGADVGMQMIGTRARRRLFPAPSRILPSEIVATGNKGKRRMQVHSFLSLLHSARGLPFPTRWRFPSNAPTVFCYRIDSDYGTQSQIEQLHRCSQRYQIPITWFLHTQAHEGWLGRFAEFEGDEVGVHCHRHRTFKRYGQNLENIRHAIGLLRQQGIHPRGFAAPNGIWNPGLADAVAESGFLYSSEFSLGYDDLPFRPWCGWRSGFGTMQIPIHPVSPGNFRRVGATTAQMIQHYQQTAAAKVAAAEPIIFYDHPTHERWEVTEAIFEHVRQHNIPAMTMGEYANWWLQRGHARTSATIQNGLLTVRTANPTSDLQISIEHQCEKGALLPPNVAIDLNAINWARTIPPLPPEQSVPTLNFKMLFHSVEDNITRLRQ